MREILLIQLKRIGDIVLTAPVVQALKEKYPNARVTMALDAAFASIAEILPADDFLFFKKKRQTSIFGGVLHLATGTIVLNSPEPIAGC